MKRLNSRIKERTGQCIDCPRGVTRSLIAGRCKYHYNIYRASVNASKVRISALQRLNEGNTLIDLIRKKELEKWYADIRMRHCLHGGYIHGVGFVSGGAKCWECDEWIIEAYFRHSTAHILPKRNNMFPSVATHPLNYLILGSACGCHDRWDRSWDDAAKMKVFPMAKERFIQFIDFIAPEETKRIPSIFV